MSNDSREVWDPASYSAADLAADLGMSYQELCSAVSRIDKLGYAPFVDRTGRRARVLSPARKWLAEIQRTLNRSVLSRLPVAESVYSQRGRGTIKNARQHVGHAYMLVMDIKSCYPSVTVERVRLAFVRCGFERHVAGLLTRLVTARGQLPQGAASSAAVLDCVLRDVDEALGDLASANAAVYTRYVDDICISGNTLIRPLYRCARKVLAECGFEVGSRKTRLYDPSDVKILTKIVVADPLQPPPEYVAELAALIDGVGRGRGPASEASIRAKIAWVSRLDPKHGGKFSARLDQALAQRTRLAGVV